MQCGHGHGGAAAPGGLHESGAVWNLPRTESTARLLLLVARGTRCRPTPSASVRTQTHSSCSRPAASSVRLIATAATNTHDRYAADNQARAVDRRPHRSGSEVISPPCRGIELASIHDCAPRTEAWSAHSKMHARVITGLQNLCALPALPRSRSQAVYRRTKTLRRRNARSPSWLRDGGDYWMRLFNKPSAASREREARGPRTAAA